MKQIIQHMGKCNRKQGQYSDRRICEMMTLNEIHYNPGPCSINFFGQYSQTQNKLLRIESIEKYSHHKQAKVVYFFS
jgi:hypothetical protein